MYPHGRRQQKRHGLFFESLSTNCEELLPSNFSQLQAVGGSVLPPKAMLILSTCYHNPSLCPYHMTCTACTYDATMNSRVTRDRRL
jgi:hypothetical protein